MKRTRNRMKLCAMAIVMTLLFIWGNSMLPATVSASLSRFVSSLLGNVVPGLSPGASGGEGLLRKIAHFSEFACLGALLGWLFSMLYGRGVKPVLLPLLLGFSAACVDETIQIFSPGRAPGLLDVGIDTFGTAGGIIFLFCGHHAYVRISKRKYQEETL